MELSLLKILEDNANLTPEQLAVMCRKEVGDIKKAIDEYEKEGVIVGYKTMIDWDKVGEEMVTAMIEVKVTPQREAGFDQIADRVRNFDEVHSVYLIAGAYDFMVVIQGRTLREISHFVSEKLAIIEDVIATSTNFVLKKYKDHGVIFQTPSQDERLVIAP